MRAALSFPLFLFTIAGCSGSSTGDDAGSLPDAFAAVDAAHAADTGPDAHVTPDDGSARDAFTPSDAFAPSDVGRDAFVVHDGGNDAASAHDAGQTSCASCGDGMTCGYPIADACGAVGSCVMIPAGSPCGAISLLTGCGCDGNDVEWHGGCHPSLPNGYAPAPITHMGACP